MVDAQRVRQGHAAVANPAESEADGGAARLVLDDAQYCATCGVVPEADRTRTYSASVDSSVIDGYIVTLDGATFLNGLICSRGSGRFFGMGCNQFFASEENAIATFRLANNNDEGHGGHIVEQLASGGWLEVIGDASGKLDNFNTIEASGTASVWYCPTPSPYPFPCARFVSCRSDLRITLTRR